MNEFFLYYNSKEKGMLVNGMQFINDENVIGKWKNIGWTEDLNSHSSLTN